MKNAVIWLCLSIALVACQSEDNADQNSTPIVRGLKVVEVQHVEETTIRRFPSVLQPAEVTTASFEIGGKMGPLELKVGQLVKKGDILASLDPTTLQLQVESSQAALEKDMATAANAAASLERFESLFEKEVVTRAQVDEARTSATTSAAAVQQARKELETAKENLLKADLRSPINGVVNSVTVEAFTTITAGSPVATLYETDEFEVHLSVNYDTVQRLAVGKEVQVRLADNPSVVLAGVVSELGSRADTVSSFPIVAKLVETTPEIKAGMAVEVAMEFSVPTGKGYLLPLTVLPLKGTLRENAGPENPAATSVFVYDDTTQTVKSRSVTVAGVRGNQIIIVDGLEPGDLVASAGVSFLREGQTVKLLRDAN